MALVAVFGFRCQRRIAARKWRLTGTSGVRGGGEDSRHRRRFTERQFCLPIDSIAGLGNASGGTRFDSGARLQPPSFKAVSGGSAPSNPPAATGPPPGCTAPRPEQRQIHTISALSKTIYLRRERLQDDIQKTPMFLQLGLHYADYGQTADLATTVDRPVMTFDWIYTLVYQPKSLTLSSGTIEATDEFDAGPKLAAAIVEQLASAVMLPHAELDQPRGTFAGSKPGSHRGKRGRRNRS